MTTYTDAQLQAIVEGARGREGWILNGTGTFIDDNEGNPILYDEQGDNAQFIIDAIRALPQLMAKVDQLEARLQALGEWESPDNQPKDDVVDDWGTQSVEVQGLVRLYLYRVATKRNNRSYWQDNDGVEYDNSEVVGWRYAKEAEHDPTD